MNSEKHITQKIDDLEKLYNLQNDKLKRMNEAYVIENDVTAKFKLEKQIETDRKKLVEIEHQIGEMVNSLNEHPDFKDEGFLEIRFKLWDMYEQLEKLPLGIGGIAEVYKVKNKKTENISALKILQERHHSDPKIIKRFWAEGKILGLLAGTGNHCIVQVRDMGKSKDGKYFIEMEFVKGKTIDEFLSDKKKLSEPETASLLLQLCTALKRTHQFDIVHRDLKPQNIMVDENNQLFLMDFGIAKRMGWQSFATTLDRFVGNFTYAAPEQCDCEKFGEVTPRTDIYSMGILTYQLLTGELPFRVNSRTEAITAHCVKPFSELPEYVSYGMSAFIIKCTQKEQKDRYKTIKEAEKALNEAPIKEPPKPSKFSRLIKGVAIASVIALVILMSIFIPKWADEQKYPKIDMVFVEGGTFEMGCNPERDGDCRDNETPLHTVTLDDFYIGKYEITNSQYAKFLNDYGSIKVKDGAYADESMIYAHNWGIKPLEEKRWMAEEGYEDYPVINVTWYGANQFCNWLSKETGNTYRLPTEAEWEFAARGGNNSKHYRYSGSNDADSVAWYSDNSYGKGQEYPDYGTHKVGEKKPNELRIYDMGGNVWEWCEDWYGSDYYQHCVNENIVNNPRNTDNSSSRVLRGGSWIDVGSGVRVSARSVNFPGIGNHLTGFRISRRISR